jgi:hypothetical protein
MKKHNSSKWFRDERILEEADAQRLSTALKELAARRTAVAVADMSWRYDLGVTILALRPPTAREQSRRVLQRVVNALAMDPNTLRRYARVAATIAPDEFARYVRLRSPSGLPLTWSHIERIAAADTAELREHHAWDACSQEVSAHELARRVRYREAACSPGTGATVAHSTKRATVAQESTGDTSASIDNH